jgi:hypothetical protein
MRLVSVTVFVASLSCSGLGVVKEVDAFPPQERAAFGITSKPEGCALEFVRAPPKIPRLVYLTTIRIDAGIKADDPWNAAVQQEVAPRACRAGGEIVEFAVVEVESAASKTTQYEYRVHGKMSDEAFARLSAKGTSQ